VHDNGAPLVVTGGVAIGTGLIGARVRAALSAAFGEPLRFVTDGVRGAAALALRRLPGVDPAAADQLIG
jgi:hypothetical protein